MHNNVVIVAAKRTAIGNLGGCFSSMVAHQLGAAVIANILSGSHLKEHEVNEVIIGQALTAGCGQNPARQSTLNAGLSEHTPALTINKVCGSGLKSVILGAQSIALGDNDIVFAGGQESMTNGPHCIGLRMPRKFGDATLFDTTIYDGLTDAFDGLHMGITAENVAKKYGVTREDQDRFACESQKRAAAAQQNRRFVDEIVPIEIIQGKNGSVVIDTDEFPRHSTTLEGLAKLQPAFLKGGTVTAGNSSGINDGAAMVLLMNEKVAEKRGITPLARVQSYASSGIEPAIMGMGPVTAISRVLANARLTMNDIGLIELNEAFAAQSIAVSREMGLDMSIVNVNGGAIALGHPIGASGARCLVTLIHEMSKRGVKHGIVSLCIGGGMGIAMCISRSN